MSTIATKLLLLSNRLLPAPALPGDSDPLDYARWEYQTAGSLCELWRAAEGTAPRRALDVGCGLGGKTHRLSQENPPNVKWFAIDIAADHLQKARAYHAEVGLGGVCTMAADVTRLPFPDASFERIVTADTLEHFPEPRQALLELRRCLTPEGRLLLQFNPWGSPRGSHLGDLLHLPWCQLLFSRETLERATLAAGEVRARRATTDTESARIRAFAESLVDHFRHHVHPTRIRQLRAWLKEDETFAIEKEVHLGPGPLRHAPLLASPLLEEWLTASYGAVLRPL